MAVDRVSLGLPPNAERSSSNAEIAVLDAPSHGGHVTIPGGVFLIEADFARAGRDLILTSDKGESVLVRNFFATETPPALVSDTGLFVAPDMAARLAGPMTPGVYAQGLPLPIPGLPGAAAPPPPAGAVAAPIGKIDRAAGAVTVIHKDGTKVQANPGDPIYQGDIVVTQKGGSIGILFNDKTTFSLGENARMALDQMVFNPDSGQGKLGISVLQGAFLFVSGEIAKGSPEGMTIKTPVATIGIRGTASGSRVGGDGENTSYSLVRDVNGNLGQLVITTANGTQSLTQENQATSVTSFFSAPTPPVTLTRADIIGTLGTALYSLPPQPTLAPRGPDGNIASVVVGATTVATPAAGPATGPGAPPPGAAPIGQALIAPGAPPLPPPPPGMLTPVAVTADGQTIVAFTANVQLPANFVAPAGVVLPAGVVPGGVTGSLSTTAPAGVPTPGALPPGTLPTAPPVVTPPPGPPGPTQPGAIGPTPILAPAPVLAPVIAPVVLVAGPLLGPTPVLGATVVTPGPVGPLPTTVVAGPLPNNQPPPLTTDPPPETGQIKVGTANDDVLTGGGLGDTLFGLAGDDTLIGLGGNDTLIGGTDGDVLRGGTGDDVLDGTGTSSNVAVTPIDVADYSSSPAGVTVFLNAGLALDGFGNTDALLNINAVRGSAFNDVMYGGNNTWDFEQFEGGAGNDMIHGGVGLDEVSYQHDIAGVSVNLATGIAVDGWGNTDTLTGIEMVVGSAFDDTLIGDQNSGGQIFAGDFERLEGMAGDDVINGGPGFDQASYDYSPTGVSVDLGTGIAIDGWGGTDALFNIEAVLGSAFDDVLTGGTGNDELSGGGGDDSIAGGAGNDVADYRFALSGVSVNLASGVAADGEGGTDTLSGIEALRGSWYYGDILIGSSAANESFQGLGGNDTIDGGGGGGDEASYFDSPTGIVAVMGASTGAIYDGWGGTDTLTNISVIGGSDHAGNTFFGGAGSDTFRGHGGNDTFHVGAGADVLLAGSGQDTIYATDLGVGDTYDGGAGNDVLFFSGGGSVTLGGTSVLNVESTQFGIDNWNVTLLDGAVASGGLTIYDFSGLGSANALVLDRTLETDGDLLIVDGLGDDTLTGGSQNDTLLIGLGDDTVHAGAGDDAIVVDDSWSSTDVIDGGTGLNILQASGGATVTLGASSLLGIGSIYLDPGGNYDIATHDANVASGATLIVDAQSLAPTERLSFDGSAETNGQFQIYGGFGNDTAMGGAGTDLIALGAGSDTAIGGGGNDTIFFGAHFDQFDSIDGGSGGGDVLALSGGTTVTLGLNMIFNVETIYFSAGGNYDVTTDDSNAASATQLVIDANSLGSANSVYFDASAETDAGIVYTGGSAVARIKTAAGSLDDTIISNLGTDTVDIGAGDDTVQSGAGNDTIFGVLSNGDFFDGGAGNDVVHASGGGSVTLGVGTLTSIETLRLNPTGTYDITTSDANVSSGATLLVDAQLLGLGDAVTFDGSAETDGQFVMVDGAGDDAFTGGSLDDTFDLQGGGDETVVGGVGDDTFVMGDEWDGLDTIDGGLNTDTVSASGGGTVIVGVNQLVNVEMIELLSGGNYAVVTDDSTVASGSSIVVNATGLGPGENLMLDASAEIDGNYEVWGGAGSDDFTFGSGDDTIDLSLGGDDVVEAGSGADLVDFGGLWNVNDSVDGGAGIDTVMLSGGATASLGASTLVSVESLVLAGGNFSLVTDDATVVIGGTLHVDASALGAGERLELDASAETNANYTVTGGAGNDTITAGMIDNTVVGGGGDDTFDFNSGSLDNFDQIDGGAGTDRLRIQGVTTITLGATTVVDLEAMEFQAGSNYSIVSHDATAASGALFLVDGSALASSNWLSFDGSAETNARFDIVTGAGGDLVTGGALNDTFDLSLGGDDIVDGGVGDDTFVLGNEWDGFDTIDGGLGNDVVTTSGGTTVILGPGDLTNVESLMLLGGGNYSITVDDAVVASGQTLVVDTTGLSAVEVVTFDGSSETDGKFVVQGGSAKIFFAGGQQNDTVMGGSGHDTLTAYLVGDEYYSGGAGNDTFDMATTWTASDTLDGGSGNDTLLAVNATPMSLGAASIANIETIVLGGSASWSITSHDANVSSGATMVVDGTALGSSYGLIYNANAETDGIVTLLGGAGVDTLTGGAINDYINTGAGADTLLGGGGNDTLYGGSGSDTFYYFATGDGTAVASNQTAASAGATADLLADFQSGTDAFRFSAGAFGISAGTLVDGVNFTSIAAAYDGTNAGTMTAWSAGNAAFIYDTATSNLYYDANGAAAGYTLIGQASSGAVAAADITMV